MKDNTKIDYSLFVKALPKLTRKDEMYFKEKLLKLEIHNLPKVYDIQVSSKNPGAEFYQLQEESIVIDKISYGIYLKEDSENKRGIIYLHELPVEEDR